jgi:hypothetical protein
MEVPMRSLQLSDELSRPTKAFWIAFMNLFRRRLSIAMTFGVIKRLDESAAGRQAALLSLFLHTE